MHDNRDKIPFDEVKKDMPWGASSGEVPQMPDPLDSSINALPPPTAARLLRLCTEGAMRKTDLDVKSIMILAALQEPLQMKVLAHLEAERMFLSNSRSKAGFLVSACEKAKQGALDVRGFGAIDPWKAHLNAKSGGTRLAAYAIAFNLEPEKQFLRKLAGKQDPEKPADDKVKKEDDKDEPDDLLPDELPNCSLEINCTADKDAPEPTVTMQLPYTMNVEEVKEAIRRKGVTLKPNKMKLKCAKLGILKNKYTLGYYNLDRDTKLTLELKERGGVKFKKDCSRRK